MKKIFLTLLTAVMAFVGQAQIPAMPPADLQTEEYTLTGFSMYYDANGKQVEDEVDKIVKVGISGNDFYISGLCYYLDDAWIKGTLNAEKTKITLTSNQYWGAVDSYHLYFNAFVYMGSTMLTPASVEWGYDATTGEITIPQTFFYYEGSGADISADSWTWYTLYGYLSLKKGVEAPVVLPEGVTPMDYSYSGYDSYYEETVTRSAQVAINGNDIYVNGLSEAIPDAWIKGTLDGDKATFAANQFMGSYPTQVGYQKLYFNPTADVIFAYNAQTGELKAEAYVTSTVGGNYDEITNAVWTKVLDAAATPAKPEDVSFLINENYGIGAVQFSQPTIDVDGNSIGVNSLFYTVMVEDANHVVAPLMLEKTLYTLFDEDCTEIPYSLNDNETYFLQKDGDVHVLFLLQGLDVIKSWQKIGVKSIYKGGNETHESEVAWFDIQAYLAETGIQKVEYGTLKSEDAVYDLQGRRIEPSIHKKGLYIKNGRKVLMR